MSERANRTLDYFRRCGTEARLHRAALLRVVALTIGVAVLVWLSPEVSTRDDANELSLLFVGLLAAQLAILGAYALARDNRLVDRPALLIAGLGLLATIAGLVNLPLDAYGWALAISVAGVAHGGLTLIGVAA